MGWMINKRTGIGFGVAICTIILSFLLCALLMVRNVLPESTAAAWIWVTYGLAALFGGRISAAGQGRQLCAFLPAAFLYGLVWLLALSCKGEIQFASQGLGVTIAVFIGAVLAFATVGGKRKKKSHHGRKQHGVRTLRR